MKAPIKVGDTDQLVRDSDNTPTAKTIPIGDSRWLNHDRFGMFIHWGLYASPHPARIPHTGAQRLSNSRGNGSCIRQTFR
jgi:hypothetical protein